jgi:hypothetical protein
VEQGRGKDYKKYASIPPFIADATFVTESCGHAWAWAFCADAMKAARGYMQ